MTYTVKVQLHQNANLEVSGEDITFVVKLLNEATRKFFHSTPAAKIEI